MRSRRVRAVAIVGTVLVCLPFAAMIVTSAGGSLRARAFLLDVLMPVELFPAAVTGGLLLTWAAFRLRRRRGLVAVSFAVSVVGLVAASRIAEMTGLGSGRTFAVGSSLWSTVAALGVYILALACLTVGGGLLVRDLFDGSDERHRSALT